jgi:hypothetical protein
MGGKEVNMSVEEIVTAIEALPADDKMRVRAELEKRLSADLDARKRAFHEALLASGLVLEIKAPRRSEEKPFRPIEVKGKPLSETIIEERR